MAVGQFYTPFSVSTTTPTLVLGVLRVMPVVIGRACTIDALAVEVTTQASAGGVLRLGVYSIDPVTGASSLLVDAGTVDATTIGVKQITGLAVAVTAGQLVGLCVVSQVAVCAIRASGGGTPFVGYATASTTLFQNVIAAWASSASTFTGTLPSPLPALTGSTAGPRVLLRASS
jgi:hypothetical protein